jgi:hypothetical protein
MTKINQLFTKIVDRNVAERLVQCLGLQGLDDSSNFTRFDLVRVGTVTRIYAMVEQLSQYYLPCKARIYLTQINEKKAITIVKQILRLHNYSVVAKEKNNGNQKVIVYRIVNNQVLCNHTAMHHISKINHIDFG